jgi:hypothetical protein
VADRGEEEVGSSARLLYQEWYTQGVAEQSKLRVRLYREGGGREPVREWLNRSPAGLPWVRPLGEGLWEARSRLENRISRVIFVIDRGEMVLLHGFIKKTQAIPPADLTLAKRRAAKFQEKS